MDPWLYEDSQVSKEFAEVKGHLIWYVLSGGCPSDQESSLKNLHELMQWILLEKKNTPNIEPL